MKAAIFCAAGMSTSILASKVTREATAQGVALDFRAYPESQMRKLRGQVDVVLLGPQIAHQLDQATGIFAETPVAVVSYEHYGRMDGAGVLAQLIDLAEHADQPR